MQHILKALPRGAFDRIVHSHQADKHSKGFGCWDQLIAMVYAQLSGASSLRVLETGFNSQGTHHYHLGTAPIRRSTLADSNVKRKANSGTDWHQATVRWEWEILCWFMQVVHAGPR